MPAHGEKSHAFYERAKRVIPYGVSSNYRYWGDNDTPVMADARDAYLFDFDGKRYIDYRLGFGPVILGHNDPFVTQRVIEAIQHGITLAATQEYEVRVAERIVEMCPAVEMVRLANTGSECTMHAMRLARGYTGRDIILKFEGSYHGAHDYVLWSTSSAKVAEMGTREHPKAYKQSWGVPELMRQLIEVCPWNDVEAVGELLKQRGHEIAAIIVEPVLGNAAVLMPQPGYLQFLREQCDQYGILLIFDEVKTGFRLAPGGAAEYFGVHPDISTFAKAMGNGYPIAAIGGKREVMMTIAPGKVFHAGTYTGNVVSTAAADATLEYIQSGKVFSQINRVGGRLIAGIEQILHDHSVPGFVSGTPSMFGVVLGERRPRDWRELHETNLALFDIIGNYLVDHGVFVEPDGHEPWFLCSDHTDADIDETLQLFEDGVKFALKSA
jgi:glutamate-1-semialdehyde 2,1-aminomutase